MTVQGVSKRQHVDFFLSYTRADVAWAEWVASVLDEGGYTTILQAWDFQPGSNFALDMHDALQRSDRLMPLLSEAYLNSAFGAAEWAAAFAADPTGREGRMVPVRIEACEIRGLLRAIVHIDLVGQEEEAAKRRLLAGVAGRRATPPPPLPFPGTRLASAPSFPGKLPAIWSLPGRNPNFAGRDAELDQLAAALGAGGPAGAMVAISGLGGVGKSQLAIEHAWRHAADYDLVWWVPAEVPPTVPGSLTALSERLGLHTGDPAAVIDLLHAELRFRSRWLMIFDNAEDPETLAPYLPGGGGGQVLVTSRNPAWRARAAILDVGVLSSEAGALFLLRRTGDDDEEAASAVAEELGYLPLALEQAGAYLDETGMALDAYRQLLRSRQVELLEHGTPAFYRRTVTATFGLAYERVLAEAPTGAEVLGTAAFLAPDDIPTQLVSAADSLVTERALGALRRLSLIRRRGDSITVHRLVSAVVRDRLERTERTRRALAATAALKMAFPNPADEHRSWPRSARLLPHVLALSDHEEAGPERADILDLAGVYLWARAQLRPAQEVLKRALRIKGAAYGHEHPEVARTLSKLGAVLRDLPDLDAACEHQQRALRIKEATYGPNHPEVARTLSELGAILRQLGDLGDARECLQRALSVEEAASGPNHPEVARTLNNLGLVLRDVGDLDAARKHQQRALRIKEAAFGLEHPEVARTLTNLGEVLGSLGDLHGAKEHLRRALRIREAAYGPDHPEVARTLRKLGIVLRELGDRDGAQVHLERALRSFEAAYGADHPHARTVRDVLDAL